MRLPQTITSTLRSSSSPQSGSRIFTRNAGRKIVASDPQNEILRRTLYPSNIRNRESPTGTWRPDVMKALRRAIPSKQAHETIERAWLLHERHMRWRRNAEAERKFECMRRAMESWRNSTRLCSRRRIGQKTQGNEVLLKSSSARNCVVPRRRRWRAGSQVYSQEK